MLAIVHCLNIIKNILCVESRPNFCELEIISVKNGPCFSNKQKFETTLVVSFSSSFHTWYRTPIYTNKRRQTQTGAQIDSRLISSRRQALTRPHLNSLLFNNNKNSRIISSIKSILFLQACAPRYIYYVFMNRMDPVGMCITSKKNFTEFRAYRPCVELGKVRLSQTR